MGEFQMHINRKITSSLAIFGMSLVLLFPQAAMSKGGATYKVTITNLTAGQPFTPPVLATHNGRTGIFSVGDEASEGVQMIAENGSNDDLVAALGVDVNVAQVEQGSAPIVPANKAGMFANSATFMISTSRHARYLSVISMLICTNDGFMGVDSVSLPRRHKTVFAVAYDARTEQNTEDYADMVPPCQALIEGIMPPVGGTGMSDSTLAEDGVVIPHAGINGGASLTPQAHGWGDPVAKIVIERVRHGDHDDDDDDD